MNVLAADLRDELRELIEQAFLLAPVEAVRPIAGQLLEVVERYAARPARLGRWRRPAGAPEPIGQVIEICCRDVDPERPDHLVVVHGSHGRSNSGRLSSAFRSTIQQMLETSARLLRLLSLLQSTRDLTGPQLSERLGVTTRTIRTDVERLRTLGYPVTGAPGRTGGYRLGAGAVLPPLLLDDEEAIAVAVGLRIATEGGVEGIAESSLRALSKLEQVLPPRLRYRVQALQDATATLESPGPTVSPDVVMAIAGAIRDHQQLRFDYTSHDGSSSSRTAEPYLLVHTRGRWYLAAWDVDRLAWRTFRADRILPRISARPPLHAAPSPAGRSARARRAQCRLVRLALPEPSGRARLGRGGRGETAQVGRDRADG